MTSSLFITAVISPLAGFLCAGLLGRIIGDSFAKFISILGMTLSMVCACIVTWQFFANHMDSEVVHFMEWINAGNVHINWNLKLDSLSVAMLTMVVSISLLIHIYSIGYMFHDTMPTYRFFAYLSLFTFSMIALITSNNFLVGKVVGYVVIY